ncbi:MAG: AarF/ABC1/UbiB kinase family protein [Spirulina sp. SIO3F2]|nr:AarF/ABC1/UbiB kinase family protein [Spirulina sp. SIO3F2]
MVSQPPPAESDYTPRQRYNPQAIAQYCRRRPWQVIARAIVVFSLLAGFLLGFLGDRLFRQVDTNKLKRAAQLRNLLTCLGPTFIKVGQALSTRPDLVQQDFLDELIKLQDQLPPFDNALAFATIERELDRPIDEVYREIGPNPIAAASLGQVYKATLPSGEQVAVKVQRPNLLPTIQLDLFLLRWAVTWLGPLLPLNLGHNLTLIVDEFGTKLYEEIDYLHEARNAERFATNFRNDPSVKVPAIYWRYTGHRVLTLEWIDGFKLTDTDAVKAAGIDPDEVIRVGVISGLRQLLEFGFFHADPHPGNLFAMADGRMAYIDFGMMDQLEVETKETIATSIVHLINRDYYALADDFNQLGFLTPETDITPIIPALERVLGNAMGESVGEFNFKTITDEFSDLMYEYPFRVPAKFSLIIRSLVTQEGLALTLNPNFKIVEIGYPYVAQRLLQGESPQMRRRLLDVLFQDDQFQWERLENMIAIAQSDGSFDLLPTAQMGLQYLLSAEGRYLRNQLLLALTENDRLHTQEVQRIWELVKGEFEPNRLWNAAWTTLQGFSSTQVATLIGRDSQ